MAPREGIRRVQGNGIGMPLNFRLRLPRGNRGKPEPAGGKCRGPPGAAGSFSSGSFDKKDDCSICRTLVEAVPCSAPSENHLETRLVHEGTQRSPFGETSETLYLTQGFIYDTAETAEARFLNEEPGYSATPASRTRP